MLKPLDHLRRRRGVTLEMGLLLVAVYNIKSYYIRHTRSVPSSAFIAARLAYLRVADYPSNASHHRRHICYVLGTSLAEALICYTRLRIHVSQLGKGH